MLKKILLPVIAVLVIVAAAAAYLFTANSAFFVTEGTNVEITEDEPVYVIRFADPEGNPVPGVMANVCSDTVCTMLTADEDGVAHFSGEDAAWSLQVLKVPEGFTFTANEKMPLNKGETVITLNKNP